ncbi:MAG TPA: hypothetical protein VF230_00895, partial [Acidimicrobiales bacterium]
MTRRPLRAAAVVAVAVLGSFGLPPAGGGAHSWTLMYTERWEVEERPVKWQVAPSIGTQHADWVPYIKKGAAEWNAIGSTMQLSYTGVAPDEGDDCGTAAGLGIVRHRFIPRRADGRFIPAHAWLCTVGDRPVSFVMELNTDAN